MLDIISKLFNVDQFSASMSADTAQYKALNSEHSVYEITKSLKELTGVDLSVKSSTKVKTERDIKKHQIKNPKVHSKWINNSNTSVSDTVPLSRGADRNTQTRQDGIVEETSTERGDYAGISSELVDYSVVSTDEVDDSETSDGGIDEDLGIDVVDEGEDVEENPRVTECYLAKTSQECCRRNVMVPIDLGVPSSIIMPVVIPEESDTSNLCSWCESGTDKNASYCMPASHVDMCEASLLSHDTCPFQAYKDEHPYALKAFWISLHSCICISVTVLLYFMGHSLSSRPLAFKVALLKKEKARAFAGIAEKKRMIDEFMSAEPLVIAPSIYLIPGIDASDIPPLPTNEFHSSTQYNTINNTATVVETTSPEPSISVTKPNPISEDPSKIAEMKLLMERDKARIKSLEVSLGGLEMKCVRTEEEMLKHKTAARTQKDRLIWLERVNKIREADTEANQTKVEETAIEILEENKELVEQFGTDTTDAEVNIKEDSEESSLTSSASSIPC